MRFLHALLLAGYSLIASCSGSGGSAPSFRASHAWLIGEWSGGVLEASVFIQCAIDLSVITIHGRDDALAWNATISRIPGNIGEPCPEHFSGTMGPTTLAADVVPLACTSNPEILMHVTAHPDGVIDGQYTRPSGDCIGTFTLDVHKIDTASARLYRAAWLWPDLDLRVQIIDSQLLPCR